MDTKVKKFMDYVMAKNPSEPEFHQAVQEVAETIIPFMDENPKYKAAKGF
jgi:glutamate dehydrogenase (NADP+)